MTIKEMFDNHGIKENTIVALYKEDNLGNPKRFAKILSNNLSESQYNKYNFKKYLVLSEAEFNEPSYNILVEDNVPDIIRNLKEGKELSDAEVKSREYALPEKRKFPLPDERHVRSAIRLYSHADLSPEEKSTVAHKIFSKMKKYGISTDEIGEDNPLRKYLKEDVDISEIPDTNNTEITDIPASTSDIKTDMPDSAGLELEKEVEDAEDDLGYDYQNTPVSSVPDPLADSHKDDEVSTDDITADYEKSTETSEEIDELEPEDLEPEDDYGFDYQNYPE